MIEGALITGGICFSYWLDFGMYFTDPSPAAWRFPIAFQIFFALLILCLVLTLPESPRWLILKGREDEAIDVLGALSDLPSDDKYVQGEFEAIKDTVLEMASGSFKDLFDWKSEDRHFHRTVLAYVNQMFQQISGINLITYYAATIYQQEIGLSSFLSRILAAANGTGMPKSLIQIQKSINILIQQSTSRPPGSPSSPSKSSAADNSCSSAQPVNPSL